MLKFQNIQIGYTKPLFEIANLELKRGKLYTFVGRNGLGKTSFFHSILGITPTLSGEILLNDHDIKTFPKKELAKLIAFVGSKFDGVQHLTSRQFIGLGRAPFTNFLGQLSPIDKQKIEDVITLLGIEKLAINDTTLLSDGERQLFSIAKALVQEAPVIILDEPTAFLDYPNRIKILEILKQLAHEQNLCIIQSSHDLDLCLLYTDDFLLCNKSKLFLKTNIQLKKQELISLAFDNQLFD